MRSGSRSRFFTVVAAALVVWLTGAAQAPAEPPADNPAPSINSLSPAAVATGGPSFTLTVGGIGFVAGSQVHWNGLARPTVFVSTTQLQAQIAAGDILVDQDVAVTVFNPAPGGGLSPPAGLRVAPPNPVPEVTGLSPAQAMAGDAAFGVTVIGSGFVPGATVLWNGEDRTTGFVNSFMLAATIRASDVAEAGTAFVSVSNPPPGGGQSLEARVFTIIHPAPALERLEPGAAWAGGPSFTLAALGSRFTAGSVLQVAGVDLPTTFISPERLEARVPATAVAHAGSLSVRVFTPPPGGGLSQSALLAVEDDPHPPRTSVSGAVRRVAPNDGRLHPGRDGRRAGRPQDLLSHRAERRIRGRHHRPGAGAVGSLGGWASRGVVLLRRRGAELGAAQARVRGHRHAPAHDRARSPAP